MLCDILGSQPAAAVLYTHTHTHTPTRPSTPPLHYNRNLHSNQIWGSPPQRHFVFIADVQSV